MLRLLIVDDEAIIRESLAGIIDWEEIGYRLAGVCRNGMEAFDFICDEYPDVVITDLKMPILNGLGLIERVRMLDPQIQFIILSGYGEFEYAKQAMKFGVKHYLLKPTSREQILEALLEIKKEREHAQRGYLSDQIQFLLQKTFFTELISNPEYIEFTINKYRLLLGIPDANLSYMVCSFLEDCFTDRFLQSIFLWEKELSSGLLVPVLYLHNVAVLIFSSHLTPEIKELSQRIRQIQFPTQTATPEIQIREVNTPLELYSDLIPRILRYSEITLCHPTQHAAQIINNTIIPGQINTLASALCEADSPEAAARILRDAFHPISNITAATVLASSLYLKFRAESDTCASSSSISFFEDLAEGVTVRQLEDITVSHILSILSRTGSHTSGIHTTISHLKKYVTHNLNSGNLSLKDLAENHFYVSVGYLSKQFVKEEGERFSDYLNRQRMEKAKKLLTSERNPNIKDIAEAVGFGNNPRYFSQVFKRYTGMTPSEYLESDTY